MRLAQAIGAVLAARYRAILNPRIIAERGDLFRGAIEDRYVGAFLDHQPYAIEAREARADRIASVIELLRVAALSSYENRPISTGVLLLGTTDDPCRPGRAAARQRRLVHGRAAAHQELLPARRRREHGLSGQLPTAGCSTSSTSSAGARRPAVSQTLQVPCAKTFQPHARATLQHGHVCAVLSPSREIKIFAEGAEVFTFRGAAWHLLDLQAKYRLWADAVGDDALALRLFQTALDLPTRAKARCSWSRAIQSAPWRSWSRRRIGSTSRSPAAAAERARRRGATCCTCSRGGR